MAKITASAFNSSHMRAQRYPAGNNRNGIVWFLQLQTKTSLLFSRYMQNLRDLTVIYVIYLFLRSCAHV